MKAFQKNQGLLLSGALAYYILLSVIPLFTFLLLMLSHVVDEAALMATLRRYIGLIIPGDSAAVLAQVRNILEHREVAGWVVLGAMLFFSSLAFSVLESAMSIIFVHRVRHKPRPLLVSLLLPYLYILMLGVGFLVMTVIASLLQSMSDDQLVLLGRGWSLDRLSVVLLYLIGVAGLVLVLTSIYLVMPPRGRISPRHALIGGVVCGPAVGGDPPHPALVFFDAVGGRRGLRLACDHDHRAAEPRDRQHHSVARRAGDRRVRAA